MKKFLYRNFPPSRTNVQIIFACLKRVEISIWDDTGCNPLIAIQARTAGVWNLSTHLSTHIHTQYTYAVTRVSTLIATEKSEQNGSITVYAVSPAICPLVPPSLYLSFFLSFLRITKQRHLACGSTAGTANCDSIWPSYPWAWSREAKWECCSLSREENEKGNREESEETRKGADEYEDDDVPSCILPAPATSPWKNERERQRYTRER